MYFGDECSIGGFVESVLEAIVSGDIYEWFFECLFDVFAYVVVWVDVEELYGFEVGLAGFHEVEAVGFGFGEGAFVGSYVFVVGVKFEEGEESGHGNGFIVEGVLYLVGVDGRCVVLCEDVFLLPLGKELLCKCVAVVGVIGFFFTEDESDEVVGVLLVELVLHGG